MGKRLLKLLKPRPKNGLVIGRFYVVKNDEPDKGKFHLRGWKDDDAMPTLSRVFSDEQSRDNFVDGLRSAASV